MPTKDELMEKHGGYTEELQTEHEQLIEKILEEEENFLKKHKKHIDDAVDYAQKEMTLYSDADKPGSDIQQYCLKLDKIFLAKIKDLIATRDKLHLLYKNVKTEESMTQLFEECQPPPEEEP